ncbi:outer membrane efflux protein [Leptospira broomii serovar Hurstbridge str. 5399]|uniref:Outer membrane efflux protein n=2 Tax=Leptospira broomii TaxID=301541 RepID=T0F944_9LEPT|nr:outer membrane efflux protein [Leptospira broomii serovar Hurstbridge str. 5399]
MLRRKITELMQRPLVVPFLRKIYLRLFLAGALTLPSSIFAQQSESLVENKPVFHLSLKDAVNYVLANNITVKNAKMEYIKADSADLKNQSQFAWTLVGSFATTKTGLPSNRNNIISGTKISNDRMAIGIQKQFETQTYFTLEVSNTRFDTNALESPASAAPLGALGPLLAAPPQYTSALTATLSQELLKYSFGRTEKDRQKVLKQNVIIQRDSLIDTLAQLVVKTLVDYWSLSVYDSQVSTFERLEKNTRTIRDITARKAGLGLSESFELNQWNSALSQTQNSLESARLARNDAERNLVRVLNADPSSKIAGITDLHEQIPDNMDPEKDYQYALKNRIDLKNLRRQKEVADIQLRIKEAEDMPSLKISGSYSTKGQTFLNPQTNFVNPETGIMSFKYPEMNAGFTLSYPLFDVGVKTDIRDAKAQIEILVKQEEELKKQIREDLDNRYASIMAGRELLDSATRRRDEAEKYYKGVQQRYSQGRFTAVVVKLALDNLIQSELLVAQAKINFNVDLIRYDLAKNYVFEKFGVDVAKLIDELSKLDLENDKTK